MSLIADNVAAFRTFIASEQLSIYEEKEIGHGYQIVVTNGSDRVPVNFFSTGRMNVQGKASALQVALKAWIDRDQDAAPVEPKVSLTERYVVNEQYAAIIRSRILDGQAASIQVHYAQPNPAEAYRATLRQGAERVSVTYYQSGTLLVQGRDSTLFQELCRSIREILNIPEEELEPDSAESAEQPLAAIGLLAPGSLLREYEIEEILGRGGFGIVYKALHTHIFWHRAIKQTLFAHDQASVEQFKTEAQMLVKLQHPALPRVHDFFHEQASVYLVMEFIPGQTLSEYVLANDEADMTPQEALRLIEPVIDALDYMHQQSPPIIHRDIKPANIRITPEQKTYLVDFGIAKAIIQNKSTMSAKQAVSPGYSPVEQHMRTSTSERTDVYALGGTLYYMLSGVTPLDAHERQKLQGKLEPLAPLTSLNSNVTEALQAVIARMMAVAPEDRYQSMAEVRTALRVAIHGAEAAEALPSAAALLNGQAAIEPLPATEGETNGHVGSAPGPVVPVTTEDDDELFPEAPATAASTTRDDDDELFPDPAPAAIDQSVAVAELPAATTTGWIGSDESGKGDVFGPLVVAAVYVADETRARELQRLGVRDSKLLKPLDILALKKRIARICPDYEVLVLDPATYNLEYRKCNNLNRLLANQHASAIRKLRESTFAPRAIVDKFADEQVLLDALATQACTIAVEQRTRAEDDIAVAAASIMARAAFLNWMIESKKHLGFLLPFGANPHTIGAGQQIVEKFGQTALTDYAKMHFRTVNDMLCS
jgi:ribonuclease HIII